MSFEWTPTKTEIVHLVLAQDGAPGEVGLSAYELTVTGPAPWTNVWTNPDTLPCKTASEHNALALTLDGFSGDVSERGALTKTYGSFTQWAHVELDTRLAVRLQDERAESWYNTRRTVQR